MASLRRLSTKVHGYRNSEFIGGEDGYRAQRNPQRLRHQDDSKISAEDTLVLQTVSPAGLLDKCFIVF